MISKRLRWRNALRRRITRDCASRQFGEAAEFGHRGDQTDLRQRDETGVYGIGRIAEPRRSPTVYMLKLFPQGIGPLGNAAGPPWIRRISSARSRSMPIPVMQVLSHLGSRIA